MDVSLWPAIRAMTEWNPWRRGQGQELGEEGPADPPAPVAAVDVDRVLGRGGIARALAEGGEGAEPEHDLALRPRRAPRVGRLLDGHDGRVDAPVLGEPGRLLVLGPRHHVEGVGALEHLHVVDRPDGLGIAGGGQADMHGRMVLLARRPAMEARRRRPCSGYH